MSDRNQNEIGEVFMRRNFTIYSNVNLHAAGEEWHTTNLALSAVSLLRYLAVAL